ncbi:hypothetical protein [Streptomyces sp. NPDC053367]|uniref:hypothetical protein n=1 Tax=Streptomyces sp. NPDC053367 TaxID=3365700 RepID=UPI0037CE5810
MPAIQPALDGTLPAPATDFESWVDAVWPTFVEAAKTGRPFVCWQVADANDLPHPPCQERDWARLMGRLHRAHVVRYDGFGFARDKSACRRWRGTRAAQAGRVA